MKTFRITIEETVSDIFEIMAESVTEAEQIAMRKYKSGEIVLEPGYLISKQMQIKDEKDNSTDWMEF